MTRDNQPFNLDEWLASFADQALEDRVDDLSSTVGSDPAMRALAETILRLKHAFPKEELSQASIKQMRANLLVRWRAEQKRGASWLRFLRLDWPSRRSQLATTAALAVVVVILIVAIPILFSSGLITASAGSETPISLSMWILLGVLVVVFLWLLNRKP